MLLMAITIPSIRATFMIPTRASFSVPVFITAIRISIRIIPIIIHIGGFRHLDRAACVVSTRHLAGTGVPAVAE